MEHEDEESDESSPIVFWDDIEFPNCHTCNGQSYYSPIWDANCCLNCNIWLEEKCGCEPGSDCYLQCWGRPEVPLTKIKKKN